MATETFGSRAVFVSANKLSWPISFGFVSGRAVGYVATQLGEVNDKLGVASSERRGESAGVDGVTGNWRARSYNFKIRAVLRSANEIDTRTGGTLTARKMGVTWSRVGIKKDKAESELLAE